MLDIARKWCTTDSMHRITHSPAGLHIKRRKTIAVRTCAQHEHGRNTNKSEGHENAHTQEPEK